jgi:RNA-directed DNA polymerase
MDKAKSYSISKRTVWEAYLRVKRNGGTYGVDEQSLEDFEKGLKGNLYKIWNRMSSGSYMPPAVRRVEIPKGDGKTRPLGIPTVSDRIAQMVVKMHLEPACEQYFHVDSYAYRANKSALDAVGRARERCWKYAWVVDLDIKAFFDSIDHELMMRAVRKHTQEKWILLYVERWLKAPVQMQDGITLRRERGTPQGSVVSPLLANLYLHYALDKWMERKYPQCPFERYADDEIIHCRTKMEAQMVEEAIGSRLKECGLELHPEKTKIVYCKQSGRRVNAASRKFDFLGFTFRPRRARSKAGVIFVNFSPAISQKARAKITATIRAWRLPSRTLSTLQEIAESINPAIRGWINYYGKFTRSALNYLIAHVNRLLAKWANNRFKKLRRSFHRAAKWLRRVSDKNRTLFAHWTFAKYVSIG